MENDDMENFEFAMSKLLPWQRQLLWLDADNNYEDRNEIIKSEVGITSQVEINRYILKLKNKFRELYTTGNYIEKHKGNDKPSLKGF